LVEKGRRLVAGYYVTEPKEKPTKTMYFKQDVLLTQQNARFAKGTQVAARHPGDVPRAYVDGYLEVTQDHISWKLVPVEHLQEEPISE
jgi:hypothetical protein